MKKTYYQMVQQGQEASIYIYGDIVSWEWDESDVTSYTLSRELQELDAGTIHVYINSRGGEVAEGLAIYSALKRHNAKVITYCDGFACSIASVIFMAGNERIMSHASMLMIHKPWTGIQGNAEELRKKAADLDEIAKASIAAYMGAGLSISEEELDKMLDEDTWLIPTKALDIGFATGITGAAAESGINQSVKNVMYNLILQGLNSKEIDPETDPEDNKENSLKNFLANF